MGESIDAACHEAGIIPDAFLSAHAHSYQRYTRRINGRQVPYIVAGTGGMPPQSVPVATGEPIDGSKQVTYDKAMASLGYLFITASTGKPQFEFWPRTNPQGGVRPDLRRPCDPHDWLRRTGASTDDAFHAGRSDAGFTICAGWGDQRRR
jgi:hypothetical protein